MNNIRLSDMDCKLNSIDWNSPEALKEIIDGIKTPLDSIISVTDNTHAYNQAENRKIIISNTEEINRLIKEVIIKLNSNSLNLTHIEEPIIFNIFENNHNVRSICSQDINPNKISKTDQSWLIELENEVINSVNQNDLNLYNLSYKMAVSERHLHRKTKELVHLTPNKYIRVLKLHKAKEFIDNYVYKSISQLSYAVGYNDSHYFSKLFFKQYQAYPKDLLVS